MFKILLQGSLAAGSAVGGIAYDATGPGGAAISSPPAGFGDLAREWWSRKGRTTNTLKLPFAAIPRPRPERKELLCPTRL